MRFSDGMWQVRPGFTLEAPACSYAGHTDARSITLYGPYHPVTHRGMTLNCGQMTVTLSAPAEGVISVRMENFMGACKKGPDFVLNTTDCGVVETDGDRAVLRSGKLTAETSISGEWGIRFYWDGRLLTETGFRGMAHLYGPDGTTYMREQLSLDVAEQIVGLGERFGPFVKNGQSVDLVNADGGTNSEQAYKNIPFYLSTKGYGLFVNTPAEVSYEIGSEIVNRVQFSVPGESMEYMVIGGDDYKEVITNYTGLTGRPPMLPAWTFGLWLSTSFTTNYDEETVLSFIDGMLERKIPLTVFHFDCFWMKEFQWTDFVWNEDTFKDPEGMLKKIHDRGIKVCCWINPYIAQKSRLFKEGLEHDYFVKTGDGSVWQWDMWQAGMALVDFTNPEAVKWYQGYLRQLCEMGVDAFKTDFGERIPVQDPYYGPKAANYGIVYHDGSDPDKMHNYYTYLYNKAVYDLLEEVYGKEKACLFARSATAGGQQFPVHWGGDNLPNYPSMAQSLRGGMSLALCGFGYWSHDIGGFEGQSDYDIFKRWTQFGLLSSHSRYHGSNAYKVPWMYGEEAVEVTRAFTKLKMRLMPYLYQMSVEAHTKGIPMMRPMLLEFPDDRTAPFADTQYMLGDSILVAPIMNPNCIGEYYLPEGLWTDWFTGETVQGGGWHKGEYDYFTLPLFVRENTILVLGSHDDRPDYDYEENPEIRIFGLRDGATASADVVSQTGEHKFTITATRSGKTVTVHIEGEHGKIRIGIAGGMLMEPSGNDFSISSNLLK